jgi:type IV secretion system protein VirB6
MGGLEDAFKRMSDAAGVYGGMASSAANILQGGPMLGSGILWLSAIVLLMSILGLIVAAKIVLAFLLAIGPIFIGLFLFDATRSLAEGWFRVTLGFALAPMAVNVFGAISLMILQPFLEILSSNAAKKLFDMGPVITIALIVTVFAIVMLLGLGAVGGITRGFSTQRRRDEPGDVRRLPAPELPRGPSPSERAEQMVARIAVNDRNADFATAYTSREEYSRRSGEVADAVSAPPLLTGDRLGQTYNRAPKPVTRPGDNG